MRFMVFDRWGAYVRDLTGVTSATHSYEINTTDELKLSAPVALAKGDHILWNDAGEWREHVVNELDQEHGKGETLDYVCEPVLMELRLYHVRLSVMQAVTAAQALEVVLSLTPWEVGTVEDFGTADVVLSQTDAYKGVLEIAGNFGCEIRVDVEVSHSGVAKRKVSLVHQLGASRGLRFEYGRDMKSVEKSILADDVITACYGYGKNLDTKTDGVQDRLWVYVEGTEEQKLMWGLPDGQGGVRHAEGMFEDSQIETTEELTAATQNYLAQHSSPSVSYKVSGVPAMQLRGCRPGDVIQTIDPEFTPELRLQARVGALVRDLLTGETTSATFGTVVSILPDVLARVYRQVSAIAPAVTQAGQAASALDGRVTTVETKVDGMDAIVGQMTVQDGVLYFDGKKVVTEDVT